MTKKVRSSIYLDQIEDLNVSNLLIDAIHKATEPGWDFDTSSFLISRIEQSLRELDFYQYDYFFRSSTHWYGILTSEPFSALLFKRTEEEILNLIKNEHLSLVNTEEGLLLRFSNPSKSPLYRFFNKHKEDGYGQNIPYSVGLLIEKIREYLVNEFQENLDTYGEWEYVGNGDEVEVA